MHPYDDNHLVVCLYPSDYLKLIVTMNFPNLGCAFCCILLCLTIILALVGFGAWDLIDHYLLDHALRSTVPIQPELEITVTNNTIDTIYVYRAP